MESKRAEKLQELKEEEAEFLGIEAEIDSLIEEEQRELNNNNNNYDATGFFYFEDDTDWSQSALKPTSCVSSS